MRKRPTKYEEVKARVKKCLESVAHVCLTTDIWTSRATQGYITVTCQFLDELWQMQTFVLETFNLTVSRTAESIAAELKRIANDRLIADKVVALVTDNASNMVAVARLTGWKHILCFAHTLNLIVQAALFSVMADLKTKCKSIVTLFHQSTKASDKLMEVQQQIGNSEVKLVQEVEARWNSFFYMFKRVLEQKGSDYYHPLFTWKKMISVCQQQNLSNYRTNDTISNIDIVSEISMEKYRYRYRLQNSNIAHHYLTMQCCNLQCNACCNID